MLLVGAQQVSVRLAYLFGVRFSAFSQVDIICSITILVIALLVVDMIPSKDKQRKDIAVTDFQYTIRRNFGTSSLGMGPTVRVDWTKDFSEGFTFPIGIGYTKTIRIGKVPYKIRLEPQYSIIRPNDYGNVWNIRLQIAPVIKSPFI